MVAALDLINPGGGSEILDIGLNLIGCAQRVARALHKQHRLADMFQMFHSEFRRLARRMKWVTEEHESNHLVHKRLYPFTRHHLRGDAAAHRLTTNHQTILL